MDTPRTAAGSKSPAAVAAGGTATYALNLTSLGGGPWTLDTLYCVGAPDKSTCTVAPGLVTFDGAHPAGITVTVTTTAPSNAPPLNVMRVAPRGPIALRESGILNLESPLPAAPSGQTRRSPPGSPFSIFQFPVSVFSGSQISNFKSPIPAGLAVLALLALSLAAFLRARTPNLLSRVPSRESRVPVLLSFAALLLVALLWMPGCGGSGTTTPAPPVFTHPGTPAGTYELTVVGLNGSGSMPIEHTIKLYVTVR